MEVAKGNFTILVKTTWHHYSIREDGNLVYCPMAIASCVIFLVLYIRPGKGIVKIDIDMGHDAEVCVVSRWRKVVVCFEVVKTQCCSVFF